MFVVPPFSLSRPLTECVYVYRITDTQFKLDSLDNDPYALNSLARPLPFRGKPSTQTYSHSVHFPRVALINQPRYPKLWDIGRYLKSSHLRPLRSENQPLSFYSAVSQISS